MGLLSIFERKSAVPAPGAASGAAAVHDSDIVQQARTRARQRLIGAVVLVGIGIIGFPLVFETQPRPIPIDIPIEIPHKEGAPALVMPPARDVAAATTPATKPAAAATPAPAEPPAEEVITETRADAGREVTPAPASTPTPRPAPARITEADAAPKPAAKPPVAAPAVPKPAETRSAAANADASRAKALLEGKEATKPEASRFIVQVGAFAEAAAAREARQKAEKLGLKTYTQVAETASGSRIRVRVGPFTSRDEADKALAKARSAGLSAVVLTL